MLYLHKERSCSLLETKLTFNYSEITDEVYDLAQLCKEKTYITEELYIENKVNRGLRDLNGRGVLTGLTEVSEIISKKLEDGREVPCDGQLYYRGINVIDLVNGFIKDNRYGFEEITYLLLFGDLPTTEEYESFKRTLSAYRSLPPKFNRDVIMKAPSQNMMNALARSVLTLYSYDENPEDISIPNVLRQCLLLISTFPMLSVYGYHAYNHYHNGQSLIVHPPKEELSIAENILHMLRPDSKYTPLEARILDVALVLHAEHGGGNNSTFTTRVVSSSGTDTYSAIAAALGSLKGPKHGGANIKVIHMFEDMKKNIKDWADEEEIASYLEDILNKRAFDKTGLIYGMGHAIYSKSDPRATVFRSFVKSLSVEKGLNDEYTLYSAVEKLAPQIISQTRTMYKGVSANIDFYSGFVYHMLGLPEELFTPIFAIARISGWSAHRIEELVNAGKIIRPAYKNVMPQRSYVPLQDR